MGWDGRRMYDIYVYYRKIGESSIDFLTKPKEQRLHQEPISPLPFLLFSFILKRAASFAHFREAGRRGVWKVYLHPPAPLPYEVSCFV